MSSQDFDVESLAAYLHLSPQQIERGASRGQLPGRKVGGNWRFSRAEVHHWMESRMGLLDDGELAQVETVLHRPGNQAPPRLADLLSPQTIAVPLQARTRGSVIRSMAELAASDGRLWDSDAMAEAIRQREELCPTALDNGTALLHPRRPLDSILAEPVLALGRTGQGIPFGGSRGCLTDLFFLICSTNDREHLQILARLSRLVGDEGLLSELRSVETAEDAYDILVRGEEQIEETS